MSQTEALTTLNCAYFVLIRVGLHRLCGVVFLWRCNGIGDGVAQFAVNEIGWSGFRSFGRCLTVPF